MSREAFDKWFYSAPHRKKYDDTSPAYLAAHEAWQAALQSGEPVGEVVLHTVGVHFPTHTVRLNKDLPHGTNLYTTTQPVVPPLTLEDLNLIRQWHNDVADTHPNYFDERDADTFAKIQALLLAGKGGEA
jgi:hypothetical protein